MDKRGSQRTIFNSVLWAKYLLSERIWIFLFFFLLFQLFKPTTPARCLSYLPVSIWAFTSPYIFITGFLLCSISFRFFSTRERKGVHKTVVHVILCRWINLIIPIQFCFVIQHSFTTKWHFQGPARSPWSPTHNGLSFSTASGIMG